MTPCRGRRLPYLLVVLLLGACESPPNEPPVGTAEPEPEALGVVLDAEQREKLGVEVGTAASADWQPSIDGLAYVVDAQGIIGAMAALAQAEVNARTSQAALQRARDLFKIDTAVSAATLEAAERQAAADDAQLRVARARTTLTFGAAAPWLDASRREPLLAALAAGSTLLVSASFPSGLAGAEPATLALRRVGTPSAVSWSASEVWTGPADPSIPGQTLLALLNAAPGVSSGERFTASVANGAKVSGAVVPLAAVVLAGGEPWCYVQTADEEFVRRRVDLGQPLAEGYLQPQGYAAGERIVVAGAGLLLARELGGGAEED